MTMKWRRFTSLAGAAAAAIFLILAACDDGEGDPRDNPCRYITCSDHGTCLYTHEEIPYCRCDEHYELDPDDPTRCISDGSINDCRGPI